MEKQKRWQFYLIVAVMALTLINILPTLFYYSKPLGQPIDQERALIVAKESVERVNALEQESIDWLHSFSKLLHVNPSSIQIRPENPRMIAVTFPSGKEAKLFRRLLPTAGALIPFVPAQLQVSEAKDLDDKVVIVERNIGIRLNPDQLENTFRYGKKFDGKKVEPFYQELTYDRVLEVADGIAGPNTYATVMAAIVDNPTDKRYDDIALVIAREILDIEKTFGIESPITERYYKMFTQINRSDREGLIDRFVVRLETLHMTLSEQIKQIGSSSNDEVAMEKKELLEGQQQTLQGAIALLKNQGDLFRKGKLPLSHDQILAQIKKSQESLDLNSYIQTTNFAGYHPYIKSVSIDWSDGYVALNLYDDLEKIRDAEGLSEIKALQKEKLNQLLYNEIARLSRSSDEEIAPSGDGFRITLDTLTNSQSFLALDLGAVAEKTAEHISHTLSTKWSPEQPDLQSDVYPIRDWKQFKKESAADQRLGLVVYSPSRYEKAPPKGFKTGSIYVIARGLDTIIDKYQSYPDSPEAKILSDDFETLKNILSHQNFIAYPGASYGIDPQFKGDYIFELSNYYDDLISATREDFQVKGSKRYAVLNFTDVEQRILARNKIDDRIQEDLLKWREEYGKAQVSLESGAKYTVPAPTQNPYWENFKLTLTKFYRGDDRKILKWGLDLSGGKTIHIGLKDQNNRVVTHPDDINQAINELYTRINKMGVSERTIRAEGNSIVLDFPGSQAFSASELVKASSMTFHIVNEKFGPMNRELHDVSNRFLQEVWNEAVVTNRKDSDSINEIAWKHMGGDIGSDEVAHPRSEEAKKLYRQGLRLANPRTAAMSQQFNDTISSVAAFREDEAAERFGQTHPLMFVFRNYALEGSSLENVQVGYDPNEGNLLMFSVKRSYDSKERAQSSPRADFYSWTSQFARDKIAGTPKEKYSQGHGWRMAVILNGKVISAPTLESALTDHASIKGRFTQREVNQLAADLKAGSLSFTPRILSEQNVSPDLGKEERFRGIMASVIAIALVAAIMIGYYHFAGLIAFGAVILNLLIMWGVLQSIDAALTLPGIAGIVLTIGMAVDANVLVFERIREEFSESGRIASAIHAGYRKAFSAIIDSNITTIMAAVILLQFDSGPIKGFAVTIIIGIVSSMFTSLFMTRYFFAGWVQNPNHKELSMAQWIHDTKIGFLRLAPKVVVVSIAVMLIGAYLLFAQRQTILGMDFTGGYSLTVNLNEKAGQDYRSETTNALLEAGATRGDIEVRELSHPNQLRIQLGVSMEEVGHPFHNLPQEIAAAKATYSFETNPRIQWVVDALAKNGLQIQQVSLENLDKDWSVMSGQLSDSMRNNALMALSCALIGILIYITFRFELKYALGAVIALGHDVVITLGIAALFHWMGFPVQIDLQIIGAIMTIIGYSLNDTIIVFDRVREEVYLRQKVPFPEIVDHALNVTLSRTLLTSGTTLAVLLALVIFGGPAIFGFSLVMTIGVLVGTVSSLFIAAPAMLFFHRREELKAEART